LTKGDTIIVHHDTSIFPFDIVEIQPVNACKAISVLDADLKVEFKEPRDYEEYQSMKKSLEEPRKTEPEHIPLSSSPAKSFAAAAEASAPSALSRTPPMISTKFEETKAATIGGGRSEYFQRLGSGYRLKDKTTAATAEKSAFSESKEDDSPRTISEVKGQWRYIYCIDPKSKTKRLVKRIPASSKTDIPKK
jgi:hypothetical protein